MCGLQSRVALFVSSFLVAFGFYVGMTFAPDLEQERRTFVDTYFFVGKFARSELFLAGLVQPEPEDIGTSTQGSRAELAIPVNSALQKDLELLIEFSLDPKLSQRGVEIVVNGAKLAEWTLKPGKRRLARSLRIPSDLWQPGAPLNIAITAKQARPIESASAAPQRPTLGMILYAVSVYQMS
jgi:hypothetical protein